MANYDQGPDLDSLGETIQQIIDRAVSSKNYQKLNQTVRQTVNQAIETGTDAVRKARQAAQQSGTRTPPNQSGPWQGAPHNGGQNPGNGRQPGYQGSQPGYQRPGQGSYSGGQQSQRGPQQPQYGRPGYRPGTTYGQYQNGGQNRQPYQGNPQPPRSGAAPQYGAPGYSSGYRPNAQYGQPSTPRSAPQNSPNQPRYGYRDPRVTVEPKKAETTPKKDIPILYKSTTGRMLGGIAQSIGGGVLAAGTGTSLMFSALWGALVTGAATLTASTAVLGVGLVGGIALLSRGVFNISRLNRFEKYVKALGDKTYCSFQQLGRAVGKSPDYVQKEVGKLISQGMFLEGHIDTEGKTLITSNDTYLHCQQTKLQQEEQKQLAQKQAQEAEAAKAARDARDPQVQEVLDKGNSFLKEIRRCNEAIPGKEISEKISRMEVIVQKIFERAEAHPEVVPDLKKLMDYYLPMTVKLLNAYAEMDQQPIQGETIVNSKKEIEATLDTLNQAFERLLDSIFKDTAMDVSTDITVLQTLLAQEGLADDELSRMKRESENTP